MLLRTSNPCGQEKKTVLPHRGCTVFVGSGRLFGATPQCAWSGEEIIIKMKLQSRYGETIYKQCSAGVRESGGQELLYTLLCA